MKPGFLRAGQGAARQKEHKSPAGLQTLVSVSQIGEDEPPHPRENKNTKNNKSFTLQNWSAKDYEEKGAAASQ